MREYDILKFLYDKYTAGNDRADLLEYFMKVCPDADLYKLRNIVDLLKELVGNKYIQIFREDFKNLGLLTQYAEPFGPTRQYDPLTFNSFTELQELNVITGIMHATIKEAGIKELERLKREKQIDDLNESLIKVNVSNEGMNDKTQGFYKEQNRYNKTIRNLTFAIAISSGLYTIFTIMGFFKDDKKSEQIQQYTPSQWQQKSPPPDTSLKNQKEIAPPPRKDVKDS